MASITYSCLHANGNGKKHIIDPSFLSKIPHTHELLSLPKKGKEEEINTRWCQTPRETDIQTDNELMGTT